MSSGITFHTLEDAQDYKKMKYGQGESVRIDKVSNEYKAVITGKIPWTEQTFFGSGSYPTLEGEKLPSVRIRRELDKYNITYDIDPEITNVLLELNRKGYKTIGSCAGHRDPGFISIDRESASGKKEEIANILRRHGLEITKTEQTESYFGLSFKPIGKTLIKVRKYHDQME